MWSNEIFNEYPTFISQYAMELLHSLGTKFHAIYFTNESLRSMMIDFAKCDDHCFYQLVLHAYWKLKNNAQYNLLDIFNAEKFHDVQNFFQMEENFSVCHTYRKQPSEIVLYFSRKK